MGSLLGCPESSRPVPVNTLASSPSPSTTLLVGTTDITLRVIDCRTFQYVNEMKVCAWISFKLERLILFPWELTLLTPMNLIGFYESDWLDKMHRGSAQWLLGRPGSSIGVFDDTRYSHWFDHRVLEGTRVRGRNLTIVYNFKTSRLNLQNLIADILRATDTAVRSDKRDHYS